MQKFVLIVFVVSLFALFLPQQNAVLNFEGEYTFYTKSVPQVDKHVTKNGNLYMVTCDSNNANKTKAQLKNIVGESVRFESDKKTFEQIAKTLGKNICRYQVDDMVVIDGFCQSINNFVVCKNKKINFQIAFDGRYITIGTPTILSGFWFFRYKNFFGVKTLYTKFVGGKSWHKQKNKTE